MENIGRASVTVQATTAATAAQPNRIMANTRTGRIALHSLSRWRTHAGKPFLRCGDKSHRFTSLPKLRGYSRFFFCFLAMAYLTKSNNSRYAVKVPSSGDGAKAADSAFWNATSAGRYDEEVSCPSDERRLRVWKPCLCGGFVWPSGWSCRLRSSGPASADWRFNVNFRRDPLGGAQDAALCFLGDRPQKLRSFAVRLLQRQAPISYGSRVTHCQLQIAFGPCSAGGLRASA